MLGDAELSRKDKMLKTFFEHVKEADIVDFLEVDMEIKYFLITK